MSKFEKTDRQREVIKAISESSATDICLFGGSRSAKTFCNVYMIIARAIRVKSRHLIVRDTFASAKASIWQDTLPKCLELAFPNLPYETNNTDFIITLPNDSKVKISGLDDNARVEKLLGQEYSTILVSEANQISLSAVNKLKTRLAEKNELIKRVFYDLNPPKSSCWTYQLFHQKVDPIDGVALDNPEDFIFFKMNPQDNLQNIDKDYIKRLERLPEKERKRFLYGEYDDSNSGAAVYAFDQNQHVSEDAKRLPGTIWAGSDFNIDYNSDIVASQHAHGLYVWSEQQIAGDTFKKVDGLTRLCPGASVVADSTAKARRTSGTSDYKIMSDAGFRMIPFHNPAVKDKIANLNRCFTLGLIKIHPSCKKLIRDLIQLKWDKHEQLDQKTDPSLSHLVDCLSYLCWHLYPLHANAGMPVPSQRR